MGANSSCKTTGGNVFPNKIIYTLSLISDRYMSLKQEFIQLLKEDEEFRLTVAAYIGLDEILRQLREHSEKFNQLLAETRKLWEEVKSLREGQEKLWESNRKLWEGQNRLWREVSI